MQEEALSVHSFHEENGEGVGDDFHNPGKRRGTHIDTILLGPLPKIFRFQNFQTFQSDVVFPDCLEESGVKQGLGYSSHDRQEENL